MAQLGARFHGMEEVTGSIPVRSTKSAYILPSKPRPAGTEAVQAGVNFIQWHSSTLYFAPISRMRVVKALPRSPLKVPYCGESTTLSTSAGLARLVAFSSTPRSPKVAPRK